MTGAFTLAGVAAERRVWAGDVIVHVPASYLQATGSFTILFANGEKIEVKI